MTVDWLLDSDPAIRWQVLRDLTDASDDDVAAERRRVARKGWGAQLLAAEDADGLWAGGACFPKSRPTVPGQPWTSTLPVLMELVDLGVDPSEPQVRRAVELVEANCRWEYDDLPFFAGEVEPCINGRTVTIGAALGTDVAGIVERLLGDRLSDGGWNCATEQGSVVSSFHSTICVLEGLAAWQRTGHGSEAIIDALRTGEDYLLDRALLRRRSTGEVIDEDWLTFAFPTRWHYDVLRGLEHFRTVDRRDPRLSEAIDVVRGRRGAESRWNLDRVHPGQAWIDYEPVGAPSRWITLRAQRVLDWWDGS